MLMRFLDGQSTSEGPYSGVVLGPASYYFGVHVMSEPGYAVDAEVGFSTDTLPCTVLPRRSQSFCRVSRFLCSQRQGATRNHVIISDMVSF